MLWPLITAMSRMFGVAGVLTDAVSGPHALLTLTAAAIAGLSLLIVWRTRAARHECGPSAAQARALARCGPAARAAYVRLRDPDAAGRPKPRGPCVVALAA